MKQYPKLRAIAWLLVVAAPLHAQDSTRNDPLLDKLIGNWNVERRFPRSHPSGSVIYVAA